MSNRPELPSDAPTFEAALVGLEAIVHDLEDGELGLAEALAHYEQGIKHLRYCHDMLEQAERKIELLTGVDSEGRARTTPFAVEEPLAEVTEKEERALKSPPRRKSRRTLLDLEDEEEE